MLDLGIWTQLYQIHHLAILIRLQQFTTDSFDMQRYLEKFLRKRHDAAESNVDEEGKCETEKMNKGQQMARKLQAPESVMKFKQSRNTREEHYFWQEWKETFAWLQFDENKRENNVLYHLQRISNPGGHYYQEIS